MISKEAGSRGLCSSHGVLCCGLDVCGALSEFFSPQFEPQLRRNAPQINLTEPDQSIRVRFISSRGLGIDPGVNTARARASTEHTVAVWPCPLNFGGFWRASEKMQSGSWRRAGFRRSPKLFSEKRSESSENSENARIFP